MQLKIAKSPLKSRLFKFRSHPHGDFIYWHLPKLHYEKWVEKTQMPCDIWVFRVGIYFVNTTWLRGS